MDVNFKEFIFRRKRMKKFIIGLITLSFIVCGSGVAMAAFNCEVKTTSEAISADGVSCQKYGSLTFIFDSGTFLAEGDWWYVDLPNNIKVCQKIDFQIASLPGNPDWDAVRDGVAGEGVDTRGFLTLKHLDPNAGQGGIIRAVTVNAATGAVTGAAVLSDLRFLVTAAEQSSRLKITVIRNPNVPAAGAPNVFALQITDNTTFQIKLMDREDHRNTGFAGLTDIDGDLIYGEVLPNGTVEITTRKDNTLCMITPEIYKIENGGPGVVKSSINSGSNVRGDNFINFNPADPELAHVAYVPGMTTKVCKEDPGIINIVDIAQGGCIFDYETSRGYCDQADIQGLYKFYLAADQAFQAGFTYSVKLEILVDGKSGDNGVYWILDDLNWDTNGDGITDETRYYHTAWEPFETEGALCDKNRRNAAWFMAVTNHTPALPVGNNGLDPTDPTDSAVISTFGTGICDDSNKATVISTIETVYGGALTGKERFLWIDFPSMSFSLAKVSSGQKVSINVTVSSGTTCGSGLGAASGTVHIGTFGGCLEGNNLIYPYFAKQEYGWWTGLAINNMGEKDGTAKVFYYESDGTEAKINLPIAKHRMFVNTTDALFTMSGFTVVPGTEATLGNSSGYMIICTDFEADGFAMIGNRNTGEGQGFIPRVRGRNEMMKVCEQP